MKKLILSFSLLLVTIASFAQSELSSDSLPRSPQENYKEFGGFLLDMGLMNVMPSQLPKMEFKLFDTGKDFNQLFNLNPDITYSQGMSNIFSPSFYSSGLYRFGGFGSTQNLQMGSFKLKNGMRLNTYGEYNANGYKVPNRSALPWEKNNFKGAFELKSANGAFGIRVEVQQGRTDPF